MYNEEILSYPSHWNKFPDDMNKYDLSISKKDQLISDFCIGNKIIKKGSPFYSVIYRDKVAGDWFSILYDYEHMHKLLEQVKVTGVKLDSIGRIIADDSYFKEEATVNEDIYKLWNAIYKYVYSVLASKKGGIVILGQNYVLETDVDNTVDNIFDTTLGGIVKQYLKRTGSYRYSGNYLDLDEIIDLAINICEKAAETLQSKGVEIYSFSSAHFYDDSLPHNNYYTSSLTFLINSLDDVYSYIQEYIGTDKETYVDLLIGKTCSEYIFLDHYSPTIPYDLRKEVIEKNSLKPIAYKLPLIADYWLSINEVALTRGLSIVKFNESARVLLEKFRSKMSPDEELKKIHYNLAAYHKYMKGTENDKESNHSMMTDYRDKANKLINQIRKMHSNDTYEANEEETIALLTVIDLMAKQCDYKFSMSKQLKFVTWRTIELTKLGIKVSFKDDDTYTQATVYKL